MYACHDCICFVYGCLFSYVGRKRDCNIAVRRNLSLLQWYGMVSVCMFTYTYNIRQSAKIFFRNRKSHRRQHRKKIWRIVSRCRIEAKAHRVAYISTVCHSLTHTFRTTSQIEKQYWIASQQLQYTFRKLYLTKQLFSVQNSISYHRVASLWCMCNENKNKKAEKEKMNANTKHKHSNTAFSSSLWSNNKSSNRMAYCIHFLSLTHIKLQLMCFVIRIFSVFDPAERYFVTRFKLPDGNSKGYLWSTGSGLRGAYVPRVQLIGNEKPTLFMECLVTNRSHLFIH